MLLSIYYFVTNFVKYIIFFLEPTLSQFVFYTLLFFYQFCQDFPIFRGTEDNGGNSLGGETSYITWAFLADLKRVDIYNLNNHNEPSSMCPLSPLSSPSSSFWSFSAKVQVSGQFDETYRFYFSRAVPGGAHEHWRPRDQSKGGEVSLVRQVGPKISCSLWLRKHFLPCPKDLDLFH